MRRLPRLNPILPSGTPAARAGSKSSLKGGHPEGNIGQRVRIRTCGGGGVAGLCAPTPPSIPISPLQTLDSAASRANPLGPRRKAEKREKELGKRRRING